VLVAVWRGEVAPADVADAPAFRQLAVERRRRGEQLVARSQIEVGHAALRRGVAHGEQEECGKRGGAAMQVHDAISSTC
jgi:hypothetical protein